MTAEPPESPSPDPHAPFGARTGRSKVLLLSLSVLYVCWFLILVWMAVSKSGD